MKYLYPLALLLLLASCKDEEKETKTSVDREKTDWSFYKLQGNVKTISEKSYEIHGSDQKGATKHEVQSRHDSDLTFNEKGLLVLEKKWMANNIPFEEIQFNGRDNMESKTQYINGQPGIKTEQQRDKSGNITAIIRRNGDNSQLDRVVLTYKGKNLVEKKSFNSQDNPTDRTTYTYDPKGRLKGEEMYLNTEYVQVRNQYEYDAENRKISETRYSKDKMIYKTVFAYDGKNVTKKETTAPSGAIEYREKSSYDKKGNLLERYIVDSADKSVTHEVCNYDANSNPTSVKVDVNNVPQSEILYTYDGHGNVTAVKISNGKGESLDSREYGYEYDDQGNWTKKSVIINGKPSFVAERKISYFTDEE